jgi:Fe2+ transport system protein B
MDIERVRKELQAFAFREFPNPERNDCPNPGVLEGMAKRKTEMTQAQLHHITHCSPCFKTFQSIREEIGKKRAARFRIAVACGAAVVVAVIVYAAAVYGQAINAR